MLFILYLAALTDVAFPHNSAYHRDLGVELLAEDGDITDTKRFKNPKSHQVLDCTYAYDTALLAKSHGPMNTAIERFTFVSQKFGMAINDRKTVVMRYDRTSTELARPLLRGGKAVCLRETSDCLRLQSISFAL